MRCKQYILIAIYFCFTTQVAFGVEGRPKMIRACLNRTDSTLDLHWYKPTDNCGTFTHFNLYGRDNPLNLYQFLGTYNNFTLDNLSIKLKNLKSWEFYLVYHTACNGTDSIYSDTIGIDNTAPPDSQIDSVSVDLSTQKTIIGWAKNPAPDIMGYFVYHVTASNSIITTTSNSSYLDLGSRNPGQGPVNYGVAAFDSCKNASLISQAHTTIWLQSVYNQCNKTITLSWTSYGGWSVDSYDIYLKIDAGNYAKIGSVISNINQFTYNFSKFGSTYCFFIRAKKLASAITSSSNTVCDATNSISPSKNSYVAKVSVINNQVEFVGVVQPSSSVTKINIYKREGTGPYALWNFYPIANPAAGETVRILDPSVNVHSKTYSYYFTTEGPCGLIFDTSNVATTILLKLLMVNPGDQTLNWNLYDKFIKSTDQQQVLLSSDPSFNYSSPWNILNTLGSGVFSYQDFTTVSITQQQICYCIRAIENNPFAPFNRKDSSYSNIECVTADPIVYFPNAIQLNGFNTIFYPKGVFIDYTKSSFQIYDRWGQIVFETNDIQKGWDGKINGETVQSDVYAYRATIIGLNGTVLHFDGTITVLK